MSDEVVAPPSSKRDQVGSTPIGVIGLGNMGLAVAERLNGRFTVLGSDLSSDRQAEARTAGIEVVDAKELTARCATVVLSLPHPSASLAVATGIARESGIVTRVVETSTVTPKDILTTKAALAVGGVELIDAAILSGVAQMRAGTAGLVIAGDSAHITFLQPLFDALTVEQTVLGDSGTAMAAKVINNAVAHVVMVLLSEAVAMAKATGLDPQILVDILSTPSGGLMRPLTHRIGERVFSGHYDGGMSLQAALKDSVLAQQLAQNEGIPIFTIPAAHSVFEMAMAEGWAREDYAALTKLWENWSGRSFMQARIEGE
ncbi:NAD(P)-dependent oxidoreductase [Cryobacterium sp. Y82]|uniref:NAD(P)-dependent oxidoreductase n=1 Tax=Cryobacterium sp. Y82 TaxID=2045017 RepID=UPI000CE322AC|nr:NAD(P)-dependent oxidoreductase [Cryobacterium sp. Y82]